MGPDRLRVLALAIVALILVIVSTWVMDWFTLELSNIASRFAVLAKLDYMGIGLRDLTACTMDGACETQAWPGDSPSTSLPITLWCSTVFAAIVAIQAVLRTTGGGASGALAKAGYAAGVTSIIAAFYAAFLSKISAGEHVVAGAMGISIERTWAPAVLILGIAVGMVALYVAMQPSRIDEPELPAARAMPSQLIRTVEPSQPIPAPRTSVTRLSTPIPRLDPAHEALVGKLKYAMSQAEITRGGIDARREDRSNVLVMWRDIVGIVARRMPPAHESVPFADVVSSAGSTLRLVPWTRLSGDPLEPARGEQSEREGEPARSITGEGELRVRAFIELVIARCPEVRVDRATRDFLDNKAPPAQLPDPETLAVHDSKLA